MSTHAISRDADAAVAVHHHHERLVAELTDHTCAVTDACDETAFAEARATLLTWIHTQLAPHVAGDETTVYQAAVDTRHGRLLAQSMLREHRVLFDLVRHLDDAVDRAAAGAYADAILLVFAAQAEKENDLLLPLLVSDPSVDLTMLVYGMAEAV